MNNNGKENLAKTNGIPVVVAPPNCNRSDEPEDEDNKKVTKNNKLLFFPTRRSCRITSTYIENIQLQLLREQVLFAVNEVFLEVVVFPGKDRGLRTRKHFARDEFVVEYKGDLLNLRQAKQRERQYARMPNIGCYMFYFTHNDTKWCIDATVETGDKGRLVNHSRLAPNMRAKVFDLGKNNHPHLCLFALRDIGEGEELTFNYGDRTPLIVEKHPWLLK